MEQRGRKLSDMMMLHCMCKGKTSFKWSRWDNNGHWSHRRVSLCYFETDI